VDGVLAIDIGNTHIKLGLYRQGRWINEWRLSTEIRRTADEYHLTMQGLMREAGITHVERVVLASVVPLLTPIFVRVARHVSGSNPLEITPPGYGLAIDYPAEMLGADRFVNALAAWQLMKRPVVVVDVGTTATVDAVADATFLGGAIAPGPHFLVQALAQGTARLPQVMPAIEAWAIGKTTQQAIQAGVGHGFVGMVRALIEETRSVIGATAPIVMTGGWATRIMPYLNLPVLVEPRLTLEGLRYAEEWHRRHQP